MSTNIKDHKDAAGPSRGDLFTQQASGRWGVIEQVLPGDAVEVSVFAGSNLPDTHAGRVAQAMGIADPQAFRERMTLMQKSIEVRRPPIGAKFGLDTRELNANKNHVEVHRHLANGFLEVRMVVHVTELLEPYDGPVDSEDDPRSQAHPGSWPALKL